MTPCFETRRTTLIHLSGLLVVCCIAQVATGQDAATEEKAATTIRVFDTLTLTVPAGWEESARRSRIIEHEFSATQGDGDDAPATRITMMAAGGDVGANIDRWKNQFSGGADAKVEQMQVAGQTVHLVQLDGTFSDTVGGGPFAPGRTVKRQDYGMLGAIIEMKDGRKYFIKATGPRELIAKQAEPFKKMLKEME